MSKLRPGMKVRYNPWADHHDGTEVEGRIILVHHSHRYFTAEHEAEGRMWKTSFKFDDFYGPHKKVFIVKE